MGEATNDGRTDQRRLTVAKTAGSSGAVLALGVSLVAATPGSAGAGGPIVVDSLADDGSGGLTLREAIDSATDGDVITFAPGLTGTITLDGSQITIDDAIEIQGPGATVLTVSGDDSSRVFYVNADNDDSVTISGLTISDGDASNGAGILAYQTGPFTLRDSRITDNSANGNGGGVELDNVVGNVTISGSTFFGNYASSDGGGLAVSGVPGTVMISDTTFEQNVARSDGGGAVFQDDIATISLTGLTVKDNTAPNNQGGGLFFYDVYFGDADGTQITLSSSKVTGNSAIEGGGINFYSSFGTLEISDTTIADNEGTYGGGVRIFYSGETTIERSTISGNDAVYGVGERSGGGYGGGINHDYSDDLTIINSTISGNNADVAGGGIWTGDDSATVTLEHVTMTANTADEIGDGIFARRDAGGLEIDHTIIAGNGDEDLAGDNTAAVSNSLIGEADTGGIVVTDNGNNDIGVADAGLLPLTNNGGPTETHALAATSPAMDAGDAAFAPPPATDQRGLPRVQDVIEKGAWEFQPEQEPEPTTTEPDGDTEGTGVTNSPAATPVTARPDFTG